MLPLGAVLFFGAGFTFVSLGVFAATLVALILLEPLAIALAPQIETAVLLSINTSSLALLCLMVALGSLYLLRQVERYRTRANNLLLNMLPESIASRLKDSSETIADAYGEATVLFADMVGSTPLFADLEPAETVDWLNEVFSMFDRLVDKYGLEKIRTIGDNYMVASGVPVPRDDHAQAMALLALDMLRGLQEIPTRQGKRMAFRVGINSGPLVAGVIGESKYQYDLWGDTVNIASRMESHGEAGRVHISKATYELLKEDFDCMSREKIAVKGKGEMETYYLVGPKSG
jgi:class 3 adenylate cyclase